LNDIVMASDVLKFIMLFIVLNIVHFFLHSSLVWKKYSV